MSSKVRDYNIPGMPFRVHQFGTPVPSLRSSQPREHLPLVVAPPTLPASSLAGDFVGREEARKSGVPRLVPPREKQNPFQEGCCYPGIGKRFIFPALFSSNVRYSSLAVALSHVCTRSASGSASVSS